MGMNPRAIQTAGLISTFAVLGTIFVALRLYTRFVIIRAPGYEDWVLISSWICAVVTVVTIGLQVYYGVGERGANLSAYQNEMIGLNTYISISTYCASVGLTKLAILMQYQRVFPTRGFQIWTWTFVAFIVAYTIATVAACIFVCWPVQKFWKPDVEGTCINTFASWLANAILNIITDLMIIILPMPVVRRLKLPKKQKVLLMGVFAFGAVVCIISIVRLHSLTVITHSTDPSYDNAPVATFSIVEINVSLICACLPTLRPLLAKYISGLSNSTNANTSSGKSHGRKRSSVLPSFVNGHGVQLGALSSKRGVERLDGEDGDDRIKVVTRVDVRVSEGHHDRSTGNLSGKDDRESSTESLFRDTKYVV